MAGTNPPVGMLNKNVHCKEVLQGVQDSRLLVRECNAACAKVAIAASCTVPGLQQSMFATAALPRSRQSTHHHHHHTLTPPHTCTCAKRPHRRGVLGSSGVLASSSPCSSSSAAPFAGATSSSSCPSPAALAAGAVCGGSCTAAATGAASRGSGATGMNLRAPADHGW